MSELFEKSIRVLELPRLLEMLERHAVSAEAKARARSLTPSDDFGEVNRLLDETDAARKMILLRGSPAFGGVRDVGESLSRAERGGMLNTRELLDIAGLLGELSALCPRATVTLELGTCRQSVQWLAAQNLLEE